MLDRRRFISGSAGLLGLSGCIQSRRHAAGATPRLAVLLVFDQLRGDYPTRWRNLYGEGGFRRLLTDGAWYSSCNYPYSGTFTAAGHATLATGRPPAAHGIIANEWYDRSSGQSVYCVDSERYNQVPPPVTLGGRRGAAGSTPERLLGPTLADVLKEATGGRGKVVSLSFKDRSAVLPGGKRPDACYWFETAAGTFVTSTYYRDRLHAWVEAFNRERPADAYFTRTWEKLRPELDYARYSGPDDQSGEGTGVAQGRTFPHPLNGGGTEPGGSSYEALYNSPFGNDLLLALARKAIDAEQLGQRDAPDLLALSFSCNDVVGHCWGPDSQEVLDCTLRTDQLIADLLTLLDEKVGRDRYAVVLSADHGVCPLPEVSRGRGLPAARLDAAKLRNEMEEQLARSLLPGDPSPPQFVAAFMNNEVYLQPVVLRRYGLKQPQVEQTLAHWLRDQPGILSAYSRTQIMAGSVGGDTYARRVRASFHPERSGDVIAVVEPYNLFANRYSAANHGTPHSYDTHVPLMVLGPGIRPGERTAPITPLAAAPVLAHFLDMSLPATVREPVPAGLFA